LNNLSEKQLIEGLGNKFIEEHNMVSEMAFQTFNELIGIISIDRVLANSSEIEI